MSLRTSRCKRLTGAGALVCALSLAVVAPALGAGRPAATSARTTAKCATAGLVVWLDTQGDAAAGSVYYKLEFTNLSGHACTLLGFPGVSAVDLGGHQLGSGGSRAASTSHLVTVANGATASAVLRITVAGNFPNSTCHRVTAAGLRVYPPNQTASKTIPLPFEACSSSGPVFLSVRAVA
jgi:Protein of unknown function (DUF4232)